MPHCGSRVRQVSSLDWRYPRQVGRNAPYLGDHDRATPILVSRIDPNIPPTGLSISFHIVGFDNVSWRTAQNTGALSFMPFSLVQEYGEIYDFQQKLDQAQEVGVRDAVLAAGMFGNPEYADPKLRTEQNKGRIAKIEAIQGQLFFLESMVKGLDSAYKDFLKAHPA